MADGRIEFTGESIESALIDTLDPAGSRWIPAKTGWALMMMMMMMMDNRFERNEIGMKLE